MSLLEIVLLLFTGATVEGVATSVGYAIGLSKRREPKPEPSICEDCAYSFVGAFNLPPGEPVRKGLACRACPHQTGGYTVCATVNPKYDCPLFKPKKVDEADESEE